MIGSLHNNSAGSVGLSASAKQDNNAAEGTGEPSKLDSLVTNLVPAIDDLTEEQLLPGPANRFIGVSKLSSIRPDQRRDQTKDAASPSGGVDATDSHLGAGLFYGSFGKAPFGLSDEALGRLEAGLRAQRDQVVTRAAASESVSLPSIGSPPDRAPDVVRPTKSRWWRLVLLSLLAASLATAAAYELVSKGSIDGSEIVPNSIGVETARVPAPAIEVGHDAQVPVAISPDTSSPAVEVKSPEPTQSSLVPEAAVPEISKMTAPSVNVPKHPRTPKKHQPVLKP